MTAFRSPRGWRWGIAAVLVLIAGCRGAESEVSGTVTLDGKSVGPGVIVFIPEGGVSNPADGAIRPDGSYFLKTSREVGLKPGKYRVSVSVLDQPPVAPGQRSMEVAKLVTPQKYADPATSGLEFDVEAGSQTIDIPLVSGP